MFKKEIEALLPETPRVTKPFQRVELLIEVLPEFDPPRSWDWNLLLGDDGFRVKVMNPSTDRNDGVGEAVIAKEAPEFLHKTLCEECEDAGYIVMDYPYKPFMSYPPDIKFEDTIQLLYVPCTNCTTWDTSYRDSYPGNASFLARNLSTKIGPHCDGHPFAFTSVKLSQIPGTFAAHVGLKDFSQCVLALLPVHLFDPKFVKNHQDQAASYKDQWRNFALHTDKIVEPDVLAYGGLLVDVEA